MRLARLLPILVCAALLVLPAGQVHATGALEGEECGASNRYCFYTDGRLQNGVASMTAVPRFYHMAQQCYLQAAMLATLQYYNNREGERWTPAETGIAQTWELDSFCQNPLLEGERVLNEHVMNNVKILYDEGSQSSRLQGALQNFDISITTNPEKLLASLNQHTPEQLVSDILWKEYLSYLRYMDRTRGNRTTDDHRRASVWAAGTAQSSEGSPIWTSFLREQIDLIGRLDASADKHIATATRYVAEIMYTEFLRTYHEHLEFIKMRRSLRTLSEHIDRMERAFATLSIKLPDAFIIGN